jgi:hypothetical protein
MSSLPPTRTRVGALKLAPEPFQAELAAWIEWAEPPDDELLLAVLKNDLHGVFAFVPSSGSGTPSLVRATLTWLVNFAPPGSYGSAQAVWAWSARGGLEATRRRQ